MIVFATYFLFTKVPFVRGRSLEGTTYRFPRFVRISLPLLFKKSFFRLVWVWWVYLLRDSSFLFRFLIGMLLLRAGLLVNIFSLFFFFSLG